MLLGPLHTLSRYDVVIVGAGPAGLSCAMALAARRKRVLVVESGSASPAIGDHSIAYGHFRGGYWNAHWVRGLGGTSNAWTGWGTIPTRLDFDNPAVGVRWPIAYGHAAAVLAAGGADPRSPRRVPGLRGAASPRLSLIGRWQRRRRRGSPPSSATRWPRPRSSTCCSITPWSRSRRTRPAPSSPGSHSGVRPRASAASSWPRRKRSCSPPASGAGGVRLALAPGDSPWSGRTVVEIGAAAGESAVRIGGRDFLRTADGVTGGVWPPDASPGYALALLADDGYQVPLRTTALSAFELRRPATRQAIQAGSAVDVAGIADRGVLSVDLPAGGRLELSAEDDGLLAPSVVVNEGDALVTASPRGAPAAAVRIAVDAARRPAAVLLSLGAIPARLIAGWHPAAGAAAGQPALVGRVSLNGLLRGPDGRSARLSMTRDNQSLLVGAGWSRVEVDDAGPYRWMEAADARLIVPRAHLDARRVTLSAYAGPEAAPATVTLRFDGVALPPLPLEAGWHDYAWLLPDRVTERLAREPIELDVATTAPRGRHVAVAGLRLGR